jgi:hypothetical protein
MLTKSRAVGRVGDLGSGPIVSPAADGTTCMLVSWNTAGIVLPASAGGSQTHRHPPPPGTAPPALSDNTPPPPRPQLSYSLPAKFGFVHDILEQMSLCKYGGRPHPGKNSER